MRWVLVLESPYLVDQLRNGILSERIDNGPVRDDRLTTTLGVAAPFSVGAAPFKWTRCFIHQDDQTIAESDSVMMAAATPTRTFPDYHLWNDLRSAPICSIEQSLWNTPNL